MVKLQKTLEFACYDFGRRAFPDIMKKRGWECPESVELSKWAELLKNERTVELGSKGKPLNELLHSITAIRHTAVHRLRTNSTGLKGFLADAEDFAGILGDTVYSKAISRLRSNVQSVLTELARDKRFIQLQLEKSQEGLAVQRAELDQMERKALHHLRVEDERCRTLAGKRLKEGLELMEDLKVITNSDEFIPNGVDVRTTANYQDRYDGDDDDMDEFENRN
jgi:hypothetical protein